MNTVKLYIVDRHELICGGCYGVLYGYNETPCPVCGDFVDMDKPVHITKAEFDELYEKEYGPAK